MESSLPVRLLLRPEEVLQAVAEYACRHRGAPEGCAVATLLNINDTTGNVVQYRLEMTYQQPHSS